MSRVVDHPKYGPELEGFDYPYEVQDNRSTSQGTARVFEIIFLSPVVHEFERIKAPTTLMLGQLDRTAISGNRAPPEVAKRLGSAAKRLPNAKLIEFPDLGHASQIQARDQFHEALLKALGV